MSHANKGRWQRKARGRRQQPRQLRFEVVEDRRMLAITVDTLADTVDASDGVTSLREAISAAIANETIDFSVAGTIELNSQLPTITRALTIDGASQITIDAGGGTDGSVGNGDGFRLFNINDGTGAQIDVELMGLTLTGGDVNDTGGAIRSSENLSLTDSTLIGNAADSGGGLQNSGTATILRSTFSDNTAGTVGGGVENFGTVSVTGSTFSGNSAVLLGGGIRNSGAGPVVIASSTITGNSAGTSGGGVHDVFGRVTLDNTIVAGNTSPSGPDIANTTGTIDGTFSLIGDGTGLTGISDGADGNQIGTAGSPIDPLLGPLNNNGGPTQTHALLAGSPALDTGDPSIVFSATEFDQRGAPFARVASGRIDIGAFELQDTPQLLLGDADNDLAVAGSDLLAVTNNFGNTGPSNGLLLGDADDDGAVAGSDLLAVTNNFGNTLPAALKGNAPASLFLSPVAAAEPATRSKVTRAETNIPVSTTSGDALLLLALDSLQDEQSSEPNVSTLSGETRTEESVLPTLDLAFSDWA